MCQGTIDKRQPAFQKVCKRVKQLLERHCITVFERKKIHVTTKIALPWNLRPLTRALNPARPPGRHGLEQRLPEGPGGSGQGPAGVCLRPLEGAHPCGLHGIWESRAVPQGTQLCFGVPWPGDPSPHSPCLQPALWGLSTCSEDHLGALPPGFSFLFCSWT